MAQGSETTVHDVVIIGSGAGGGTVTKVLADMGIKVLLLEAGPMIDMTDFKTMMGPSDVWHRGAGELAELYTKAFAIVRRAWSN
jgi:choline dehydrogenase-like flavoprotein